MNMEKIMNILEQCKVVGKNSKCTRAQFGAIIMKDGVTVGTGYNGSARGVLNCGEDVPCLKDLHNERHHSSYDYCPAVHAEENAIINSNREDRIGATLFLAEANGRGGRPCIRCRRMIVNAQIKDVYYLDEDGQLVYVNTFEWIIEDSKWMRDKLKKEVIRWK